MENVLEQVKEKLGELTPAEWELIRIKREEEESKKAAEELKYRKEVAEAVLKVQKKVEAIKKKDREQREAENIFLLELGEGWSRKETFRKEAVRVTKLERIEEEGNATYKDIVLAEDTVERIEAVLIKQGYSVKVKEHFKLASGYFGKDINLGYKMFLSGPGLDWRQGDRALSKADTVNKKIEEIQKAQAAKLSSEERENQAAKQVQAALAIKFPQATLSVAKEYEYHDAGRGRTERSSSQYVFITITFPNKITCRYKVYGDASLSLQKVTYPYPSGKDSYEYMDKLSKITFNF